MYYGLVLGYSQGNSSWQHFVSTGKSISQISLIIIIIIIILTFAKREYFISWFAGPPTTTKMDWFEEDL